MPSSRLEGHLHASYLRAVDFHLLARRWTFRGPPVTAAVVQVPKGKIEDKGKGYSVGPCLLFFFLFVVVGSTIFQILKVLYQPQQPSIDLLSFFFCMLLSHYVNRDRVDFYRGFILGGWCRMAISSLSLHLVLVLQ